MFGLVISFLTITVTARTLDPAGNGIYSFSLVFIGFAGIIFGFGIQASNVYFIGEDRKNINSVLGINFLVMFIAILGNLALFALNMHFHFAFLKTLVGWTQLLVLLTVPLYILKTSLFYILLGIEEVIRYNKMMAIDKALTFLLLVIVLLVTRSPRMTIVSNMASNIMMVLFMMFILFVEKGYRVRFDRRVTKGMFSYGLRSQMGNLIQSINYRLDVFVTAAYLSSTAIGLYGKASNLGETLWRVSGSVGIVVLPFTANSKDKSQMTEFMNKVIRVTFATILLFALVLTIISKPIIILVLGRKFAGSVEPFKLLIPGISIFAINNIFNNYFVGSGLVSKNIIASGIAAVITVILDFTLIPVFGINGAAVTSSISYTVCTVVSLYFYQKATQSKLTDILILKKSDVIEIRTRLAVILGKRKAAKSAN